ncbi:MAG: ABC transporter permease [Desulfovibrio sp.]|jgi:ribose/xylose/arabinose/galactoside ABC-type transport system permease subunit|nr:ABC transporter permease [Desulfovibrio sp.]
MSGQTSTLHKRALKSLTDFSPLVILIVVLVFFQTVNALRDNSYLTMSNASVIVNQACFLTIIGIAQALTILTGGLNLSIGSVMAFTTVMWGRMLVSSNAAEMHYLVPMLIIVGTGMVIGLINGLLITKLKMPPFIATFATMYACRGLAWLALGKRVIYNLNPDFRWFGTGIVTRVGGFTLTVPMLITLLLLAGTAFMLTRTNFGRRIYFTGANPVAAKFSGIPTDKIIILVYVLSTGIAAFAGLLYGARLNSFEPGMAVNAPFEAITVALIGGIAMSGGFGNIWGVLCGAVIVAAIHNGMNSMSVPSELQTLVMGSLIIFAVAFNQFLIKRNMELRNELDERVPVNTHESAAEQKS